MTLRKYLVVPMLLVGLGTAFAIVCVLLALNRGSATLLRRKLRIGAMILTLQGVATTGSMASATCYDQSVVPWIEPTSSETGTIHVAAGSPVVLEGIVVDAMYEEVCYALFSGDELVTWGQVEAADGTWDSDEEPVRLTISPELIEPGRAYDLRVMWGPFSGPEEILAAEPYQVVDTYTLSASR